MTLILNDNQPDPKKPVIPFAAVEKDESDTKSILEKIEEDKKSKE